jgi:hypothetical protein
MFRTHLQCVEIARSPLQLSSSRSVNVAGTRTRRQIIGLIPVSQTLICRIAASSATGGGSSSSTRDSFYGRFIQPDLPRQP